MGENNRRPPLPSAPYPPLSAGLIGPVGKDLYAALLKAREDAETATAAKADAVAAKVAAEAANETAQTAKETAVSAKETAVSAKETAVDARDTAVSAKDTAVSAKQDAESASGSAYLYSTYAANSAASALESKNAAQTSAESASSSANNAASSAGSAAASESAAQSAKTAAQTAQAAAEAWATGSTGGTPGASNNAEYWAGKAQEWAEEIDPDTLARIDGLYENMTVGNAEQLVSAVMTEDKVPYTFRTAGGSAEIGDRAYGTVVGGTIVWNQQIVNGNFENTASWVSNNLTSFTVANNVATLSVPQTDANGMKRIGQSLNFTAGHKVFLSFGYKGSLEDKDVTFYAKSAGTTTFPEVHLSSTTNWVQYQGVIDTTATGASVFVVGSYGAQQDAWTLEVQNIMLIDLTQMFGSSIADYVYELEQATAGSGAAWFKKLFPKPYYAYNAGTLESVQTSAHETVGFNQYDNSSGTVRLLGGQTYQITGAYTALSIDGAAVTPDSDGCFTPDENGTLTVTGGDSDTTCVHFVWDGERNGEYEPYRKRTYPLDDSLVLRGIPKLDANDRLYFDGDVYASDGTVTRRYGIVDLGTLTWTYANTQAYPYFVANIADSVSNTAYGVLNVLCEKYSTYPASAASTYGGTSADKTICKRTTNTSVMVQDTAYTDAGAFKTAMSGVYLIYELATPTTETADPYQSPQIVDDFGTERYADAAFEAGDRDFEVPVGHDSLYQANLKAKLEMSPNSPNGDGDYIVRQSGGLNTYVPLAEVKELPDLPTEDGTYTLKCMVSGGAAALSWVAE